jgi:hypothetical protein
MAIVRDVVKVTIKELNLSKVEPITDTEWSIINNFLLDQCVKG